MNIKTYEYDNIICREGTTDECTILQAKTEYRGLNLRNNIVLDCGSNIGGFARYAIGQGAKRVLCFEPDKSNYKVLQQNTVKGIKAFNFALHKDDGEINLYEHPKHHSMYSTFKNWGGRRSQVPCISLRKMLNLYKPDILKIDCEGGEYELFDYEKSLRHVKEIGLELHFFNKIDKEKARELLAYLKGQGFMSYRPADFNSKKDTTLTILKKNY